MILTFRISVLPRTGPQLLGMPFCELLILVDVMPSGIPHSVIASDGSFQRQPGEVAARSRIGSGTMPLRG